MQRGGGCFGPVSTGVNADMGTSTACHNVVVMSAPSGGIGLSTLSAMLSLALHHREYKVSLVDADCVAGGLDVLLGLEGEPGLRFSDIDAPLGHIEGKALYEELPHWEEIAVLSCDPWNGRVPDWWELQAAVRALSLISDVVVVDAGRGREIEHVQALNEALQVSVIELSVLGLARAKTHAAMLKAAQCSKIRYAAMRPRGGAKSSGSISVDEASSYIGSDVSPVFREDTKLCANLLDGLGIQSVGRRNRKAVSVLAEQIEQALGLS